MAWKNSYFMPFIQRLAEAMDEPRVAPMISYLNALQALRKVAEIRSLPSDVISAYEAVGRVISEPLVSPEEVPSFANSAMDGFVLRHQDSSAATSEGPLRIPVRGLIAAGDSRAFDEVNSRSPVGVATEIMTGAPIPTNGFDAVLRIEDVRVERNSAGEALAIYLTRPARPQENIRLAGTDFSVGQPVLSLGTRVGPEHLLACATLGVAHLTVKRKLRVGVVSTGSELTSSETKNLKPGMIRNSTGPFLLAALQGLGVQAEFLGLICDDPSVYKAVLERAMSDGVDIIISTGAVSVGKFDFVSEVLTELGAKIHFHKAAIRPGKPILFAELIPGSEGPVFFGMPGNPVATAVGLRFFVEPYLRALLRLSAESPFKAVLSSDFTKPAGLRCFFKARAESHSDGLKVQALKGQASYVVSSMLESNCWVVLTEEGVCSEKQSSVDIFPLRNGFEGGFLS